MIWLLNDHGFFKAKEQEILLVRKKEKIKQDYIKPSKYT